MSTFQQQNLSVPNGIPSGLPQQQQQQQQLHNQLTHQQLPQNQGLYNNKVPPIITDYNHGNGPISGIPQQQLPPNPQNINQQHLENANMLYTNKIMTGSGQGMQQQQQPQPQIIPHPNNQKIPQMSRPLSHISNPQYTNAFTNGVSNSSSRTSSPALNQSLNDFKSTGIPPSQLPPSSLTQAPVRPAAPINTSIYSQQQQQNNQSGTDYFNTYNTSQLNNNNINSNNINTINNVNNNLTTNMNSNSISGVNTSNIANFATPPRAATGLATPLNSSTPNLVQTTPQKPPSVNGTSSINQVGMNITNQRNVNQTIPELTSGVQNLLINPTSINNMPIQPLGNQNIQYNQQQNNNFTNQIRPPPTSQLPPIAQSQQLQQQQQVATNANQTGYPQVPGNPYYQQQQQQPPLSTNMPNQYQNMHAQQPPLSNTTQSTIPPPLSTNKRLMYPQQQLPSQPPIQQQFNTNQQLPMPGLGFQQPNAMLNSQNQNNKLQYQNHQFNNVPGQPPQQQQPLLQQQQHQQQQPGQYNNLSVTQSGFNRLWGQETIDLMQNRHVLPTEGVVPPSIKLNHQFHEAVNCDPDIFRCTLTKIPETNSLLQKSRLPLGILIHPFRDLTNLPVISCSTIVRCRACRTYINPFIYFVDSKKWKCNLCYRVNELPDEFQYDPVSKSYGDVTRRPEVKSSTIEFIAPSEYMLRPPQPAIYLFLLDVSMLAIQSGYLNVVCENLINRLDDLPGDARTQVGFIAFNSALHFYSLAEGFNQPHEITILDIDDVFLPCPDNLLVNLKECKELIKDLLTQLPIRFQNTHDSQSALGAALQIAYKMMGAAGGRVTVFQTCLPNIGPGALQAREDPNNRSSKEVTHLGPATDFYKRLALECSGQQIAVDLFLLNSQYSDLATLSGISKFSGGCIFHFPLFNASKPQMRESFSRSLERYIKRKIGFEAVMRVRCTRGLAIHTFHGNFFVRSTDLLSLPNVNPDVGFGMQISYDENLTDIKTICFQAALLYTSSKGERRIRVHTLCLPVVTSLSEVLHSADVECIIGLLSKMAVDRSLQSNLSDARDAFINATVDIFSSYRMAQNLPQGSSSGQLMAPSNLTLLPLYILALLKNVAFRTGTSTRLDDRVFAMCQMKTLPLDQLIRFIYPEFYLLDCLFMDVHNDSGESDKIDPPRLQLSAEKLDSRSIFLIDEGLNMLLLIGSNVAPMLVQNIMGVANINEIPELCYDLPTLETNESKVLHEFLFNLNEDKPYNSTIQIIRDNSTHRSLFIQKLTDDRTESSLSYYEFLQHLRTQVK